MNKKFWKHYRIVIVTISLIFVFVLSTLWLYLDAYEKSMPEYQAENVVKLYKKGKIEEIVNYIPEDGTFNTKDVMQKALKEDLNVKDINYEKKSGKFTKEHPTYSINSDKNELSIIELKKSKRKGLFKTNKWEIEKINHHFDKQNFIFIVKKGEEILLNGIEVDEDKIITENYYPEKVHNLIKYIEIEPLTKYEVDGVYPESTVVFKNSEFTEDDYTYTYKYPSNDKLLEDQKEFIENWCKNYTKYVVNEAKFNSISSDVIYGSEAYNFLRTVANTNIWLAKHTQTNFSDFTFANMEVYNDDAFSVDISYKYSFYVEDDLKEYDTRLTLFFIKINNSWKIADLTT